MDWFSAIFAFKEWPMWPLAMEEGSNWGERLRFRSRSTRFHPQSAIATPTLGAVHHRPLCESLFYCRWQNSSPIRFSDIWSWAFLQGSWLTQFTSNGEAWTMIKARKWCKKEPITWWMNESLFSYVVYQRRRFEESMWEMLSLGVVLQMVGFSVSIQCYDCNKKDRFREMVSLPL